MTQILSDLCYFADEHIAVTNLDLDNYISTENMLPNKAGRISHEQAKLHAETEFEKYYFVQDRLFKSDFDRFVELEAKIGGDEA